MSLSKKDLSLVGATLYLCEGTRARTDNRGQKNFAVEFTNMDPRAIVTFIRFLRVVIRAEESRLKAELFIYPDHNENKLIKYWSRITKIPLTRFEKTIQLQQKNRRYKPNPLGTLKIRYFHKAHFIKIQDIINRLFPGEVA